MRPQINLHIIENGHISSNVISGGQKIVMELARRWKKEERIARIYLYSSNVGIKVWEKYEVNDIEFVQMLEVDEDENVYWTYLKRMIKGSLFALKTKFKIDHFHNIVYSASDFWPESIPGFLMSRQVKGSKWIAAFYLFAPNPLSKGSPYKGRRFIRGLLYYLSQRPVYWLIRRYADMVFVTSEPDRWKFIGKRLPPERVIAIQGGVDTKTPASVPEPVEKKYDAVFIGRFHPQKGVLELVDIWEYVCEIKKDAKLAMIGVGDLEKEVREKISKHGMGDNIDLLGFQDGIPKYKIFKSSRLVVHPAIYDSGGMAACEAMACGLPGVSFDLEALKTYYPKGMLKTPCFDFKAFAENILKLLKDEELYQKTKQDALDWSAEWDWDRRAQEILDVVQSLLVVRG